MKRARRSGYRQAAIPRLKMARIESVTHGPRLKDNKTPASVNKMATSPQPRILPRASTSVITAAIRLTAMRCPSCMPPTSISRLIKSVPSKCT